MMVQIIGWLIICMIGLTSLLIHEIGHILQTVVLRPKRIQLMIGLGKLWFSIHIGCLQINIHRFFLIRFITISEREKAFNKKEMILISLMGPLFNILIAIVCYLLFYLLWGHPLIYVVSLFNVWIGLINLIPFKIGQTTSDGYTIYKLLIHSNG